MIDWFFVLKIRNRSLDNEVISIIVDGHFNPIPLVIIFVLFVLNFDNLAIFICFGVLYFVSVFEKAVVGSNDHAVFKVTVVFLCFQFVRILIGGRFNLPIFAIYPFSFD